MTVSTKYTVLNQHVILGHVVY